MKRSRSKKIKKKKFKNINDINSDLYRMVPKNVELVFLAMGEILQMGSLLK